MTRLRSIVAARAFVAIALAAALLIGACSGSSIPVIGVASAGPSCPTVPKPSSTGLCALAPVSGVHLTIVMALGDNAGPVVADLTTDETGAFRTTLRPGHYRLVAENVPGTVAPSPLLFDVVSGGPPVSLAVRYDAAQH